MSYTEGASTLEAAQGRNVGISYEGIPQVQGQSWMENNNIAGVEIWFWSSVESWHIF